MTTDMVEKKKEGPIMRQEAKQADATFGTTVLNVSRWCVADVGAMPAAGETVPVAAGDSGFLLVPEVRVHSVLPGGYRRAQLAQLLLQALAVESIWTAVRLTLPLFSCGRAAM
jgi:hypothetical protein